MDGAVIPDLGVETQALHFFHRGLAAIVGVIVVMVCLRVIRRKSEFPAAARYAHLAAGLFAVEVLIGAANVWTTGNSAFVTAHLAVGASIWASLVAMAVSTSEALLGVVVERGFTAGAAIAKVSAR